MQRAYRETASGFMLWEVKSDDNCKTFLIEREFAIKPGGLL
jgi:hypothetical protein